MMNNFMVNNLPQTFYNQISNPRGGAGDQSNYSYEINLNAVNKSLNSNGQPNNFNQRSASNDYDNNQKTFFMKKEKQAISGGGNNVIIEQEAENNEEESYYISSSPPRRGKSNQKPQMLSNNPSTLGIENAGNQQNQQLN